MQPNDWCICKVNYYGNNNRTISAGWLLLSENTRALWENGDDECDVPEDKWAEARAKEDEISLFEKLSIRIPRRRWSVSQASLYLWSGPVERRRRPTPDPAFVIEKP